MYVSETVPFKCVRPFKNDLNLVWNRNYEKYVQLSVSKLRVRSLSHLQTLHGEFVS